MVQWECQKALRLRRVALKKFQINPTRENLNNYKNSRAKARKIIKDSKWSKSKNYVAQKNNSTKPKNYGR